MIQGMAQGMHKGWDASSSRACCYQHRWLPQPTRILSLCRRIRPLSLLAFPPFPHPLCSRFLC